MRRLTLLFVCLAGCDQGAPPAPKFFERSIQPILTANCVQVTGGCHRDDGSGNALGNLDLSTYQAVTTRRDVLRTFGSYPVPLLLVKAAGKGNSPPIPYQVPGAPIVFYNPEIDHNGSTSLSQDSTAYFDLLRWMSNGAAEDGSITEKMQQQGTGPCRTDFMTVRPDIAAQINTVDTSSQAFQQFRDTIEPTLRQSCAFATCHSGEQSDFFLTCGDGGGDATKFNFLEAQQWVTAPPEQSLVVLKPLSPSAGGIAHTGGVFFQNQADPTWQNFLQWATAAGVGVDLTTLSAGQRFFYDNVMPVFLRRGCAFEACHSPGSANDFKLRAGTRGFFSTYTLAQNYRVARTDFLAPELADARQSRLLKKPAPVLGATGGYGIVHRGGPVLATPGESLDPRDCPAPWTTASSPFCTFVEWHRLERAALLTAGKADAMNTGDAFQFVVVKRPPDGDSPLEFDTYRAGADLRLGHMTLGALGAPDPTSAVDDGSLIGGCPGFTSVAAADVRQPDVSYDGTKVAFALRNSASDTLDIYEVVLSTKVCTKITDGNGQSANMILKHNFDPMYAPEGSLVFASTRGKAGVGPTRSLKQLLPQSDLWRMRWTGSAYGAAEQMTALSNSEFNPAMMMNGQISFSTEKAAPEFYQISGRRINWDLTDYHPLLAQRSQSRDLNNMMLPSVNFQQATDIREAWDRNFLVIFSDSGAKGGGGALATFNRSVGPFEADRVTDTVFLRSVTMLDGSVSGHAGGAGGAYRSPVGLPDGHVLVSYSANDPYSSATLAYGLYILDPATGARTALTGFGSGAATSFVEGAVVMRKDLRPMFNNVTQLVFGGKGSDFSADTAQVHYPDLPMLSTLLQANLRTGRFVDEMRKGSQVTIYQRMAPPSDINSAKAGQTGSQMVYEQLNPLANARLQSDGSVLVNLPPLTPMIIELQDATGATVMRMTDEDQLGPGEFISRGVPQQFFNSVCGGCHGSVSGRELDIAVNPDALTTASVSQSRPSQ